MSFMGQYRKLTNSEFHNKYSIKKLHLEKFQLSLIDEKSGKIFAVD